MNDEPSEAPSGMQGDEPLSAEYLVGFLCGCLAGVVGTLVALFVVLVKPIH